MLDVQCTQGRAHGQQTCKNTNAYADTYENTYAHTHTPARARIHAKVREKKHSLSHCTSACCAAWRKTALQCFAPHCIATNGFHTYRPRRTIPLPLSLCIYKIGYFYRHKVKYKVNMRSNMNTIYYHAESNDNHCNRRRFSLPSHGEVNRVKFGAKITVSRALFSRPRNISFSVAGRFVF